MFKKSTIYPNYEIMKTRIYKADPHCDSCVRYAMPYLNSSRSVESWHVETTVKEKILTVHGNFVEQEVDHAMKDAGFEPKVE